MTFKHWLTALVFAVCTLESICFAKDSEAKPPQAALELQTLYTKARIPKVVVAQDGTVLAFADSCQLLRRSNDQGKTWSEPQTVDEESSGNAVIDETTGDILLVYPRASYLRRSKDSGKTWTKEEITIEPNLIGHGAPDKVAANVGASESGITLQYGEHKGRLVMPARIQPPYGDNKQEYWQYNYNTSIYSDDHGKTWQVGEPVQSGTGEGTLAELSDGRLYYNSRSHLSADHRRQIAWSHDGGRRWVDWEACDDLLQIAGPHYFKYGRKPSYGCNAGLVRVPLSLTGGKDVLLYSAPDNPGAITPFNGRIRMSVWASTDGAKTWPIKRLVHEGISSYSSIEVDNAGNVYVFFESGEKKLYENLKLARFPLASLLDSTANKVSLNESK
jgi:sialidase-1